MKIISGSPDVRGARPPHEGPVVAAVNGDALDSGFELASAADVRLMARGLIGTSGAPLTADEAAAIGLVERSASPAGLLDEAIQHTVRLLEPGRLTWRAS